MPFILIKGTFHLVNTTSNNRQVGFQPDGDSMQFKPANANLLDKLEKIGRPYDLTNIGSVQLRFEGIDALELHYQPRGARSTHQPRPLGDNARDFLTGLAKLNPVPYVAPRNISVDPPIERDATPGYILSRSLEVNGRPVAFAFAGTTTKKDGSAVNLTIATLKRSSNYKLLLNGHAYPLFYDTLFADLRTTLADATRKARAGNLGLWAHDGSMTGIVAQDQESLELRGVTFPKLFRRLADYFAKTKDTLPNFMKWLKATREQVQDLDPDSETFTNVTHFDNMVRVASGKVSLRQQPETMLFISAKSPTEPFVSLPEVY
ncbi:MAG: thermonuclease family protein [Pyrinomonadaceae bacterium]